MVQQLTIVPFTYIHVHSTRVVCMYMNMHTLLTVQCEHAGVQVFDHCIIMTVHTHIYHDIIGRLFSTLSGKSTGTQGDG